MQLSAEQFQGLFPFYFRVNKQLEIFEIGDSLKKIAPKLDENPLLFDVIEIKRPFLSENSWLELIGLTDQLIILSIKEHKIDLRGQFEFIEGNIAFLGTPWFTDMQKVVSHELTINDFAHNDPLLDLLHVVNNHENVTQELKQILQTVNTQKNKLKKDKEELNRLSLVASANEKGVVFTYPTGEIFWCNDAYLNLTGYQREEVLGKTPLDVGYSKMTNPDDVEEMVGAFTKGEVFDLEIIHGRKDGSFFWTKTNGQPVYDEKGQLVQYFSMIEDISDKKSQEEQIMLLSSIAEKNINAVVISDKEGRIEWVNSSFLRMSGYTLEEMQGIKPGKLLQGKNTNPETVLYLKEQIHKGEPFNCEIINYHKDGTEYWVGIQGQALFNKEGEIIKFFAIEEDITVKKKLEHQREELVDSLAKSNKELEDYAQIVSHDLKSPLRSIHSLLTWIKEDNDSSFNEDTLEYFSLIEGKVEQMDRLINGILTYSKIDKIDNTNELVNTNELIADIIQMIHKPDTIDIVVDQDLPILRGDKFRFQQLFQNLIGNAVNYIDKPKGLVEVSYEEKGIYHVFAIKDNGIGIKKENQKKVFDTFKAFTNSKHSTGLGLSIVKKIIESYKGKIWLESEFGKGTTFFIQLKK